MGWAARKNLNSKWNRNRNGDQAAPEIKASIPVSQDEPVIIELTLKNIWGLLCRKLIPTRNLPQNLAPTS